MDREALKAYMPHREPMLLLDAVDLRDDGKAVGTCHILPDAFYVQGHFPGNPVVPGVILCEMMAQTCCVMTHTTRTPYFVSIKNAEFKRKVVPGETITFVCGIDRTFQNFIFASGEGSVDGALCVRAQFAFALVEDAEA